MNPNPLHSPPHPFVLLVGSNFTPASDVAVDDAIHIARRVPGCAVHLARVVPLGTKRRRCVQIAEELERYSGKLLDAESPRSFASPHVTIHVRSGRAAVEIARLAAELAADLLVVGRSKKLASWWRGDMAERLARRVSCPMLVARERPVESTRHVYIDPPCADCLEARKRTDGRQWWCVRHAQPHVHGHAYHYRRELPFAHHDSAVIPTGTDFPTRPDA